MQRIRCALVAREGVNRCHVTPLDTDRLVEDIRHWGEAVRRAGRIRDDRMARVQLVVVDTVDQRQIGARSRRGDQHALSASVQMFRGALLIGEDAGAFHRDIDVEFFHGSFAGSRSAVLILPLPKSSNHVGADLGVELSMYRVVFQKVGVAFRIAEIVDADEFDIFAARLNCGS